MIFKLLIKNDKKAKKKNLEIWIQKHQDFEKDLQQLLEFFKESVTISKVRRLHDFYKITSDNPAIMLNMFSTIQELIPEIYFKEVESSVEDGETS